MTVIKLHGLDRYIPKLVYCLDKTGLKLHNRYILSIGRMLCSYISKKYNVPPKSRWMLWNDHIEF